MKITGTIHLQKTEGRKDAWVKKQLPNDYFLSLEITQIGDHEISTLASAFNACKTEFPSIKIAGEEFKDQFVTATLPVGAKDVCHIVLGNFGDFRKNRDVANELDDEKIALAEELEGEIVSFDIDSTAYQVVSTSELYKNIETKADLAYGKTVGFNRDGILNLFPGTTIQKMLAQKSKFVFGDNFELWNAQKQPIPYNITLAQTNNLNQALQKTKQNEENREVVFSPI
ncbi:hypothetical protein [Legionella sp. WA2022007384]